MTGEEEAIKPLAHGELSRVPYAEPTWLSDGFKSPYYSQSHRTLQKAVRKFMEDVVLPEALISEERGKRLSQDILKAMSEMNFLAMRLGPGKHLGGLKLMGGLVTPEEFDYFHELVIISEIGRITAGLRSIPDALVVGGVIGLPPVLNFASPDIQARVIPEVLQGKKLICLAISEAFAGSDVSGLQTTAEKTSDGKFWIINGTKKWITNGVYSDYFTVGCRTKTGFTVILVERSEGVETKPVKTSYSAAAGTAFVTFDNVRVPVGNTLGQEGKGMSVILSNFNHERWMMCGTSARTQRAIVEECLKWTTQRKVFGRPLHAQPVIRAKLAQMISRIESCQTWLENVTYQMCNMNYQQQSEHLAGQIGLLKQYITQTARATAEDATQIFGGRGITMTGMGSKIENYHRTSPFDAILGGAEDVLGDMGVRQALKKMPKSARL